MDGKLRPCAHCGAASANVFCQTCYGPVDGGVKKSFGILMKLGSPKLAIQRVLDCLDGLRKAGVPLPDKITTKTPRHEGSGVAK